MIFSRLLPYGSLIAIAASQDVLTLTGASEGPSSASLPTGSYISISTTITQSSTLTSVSPSAITTSALISTISSGSTTRTTTLGSTILFGIGTSIITANNDTAKSTSPSEDSQLILSGRPQTTMSGNGTMNGTATSTTSSAPQPTNTTPCNNYVEFCGRRYGNITEVAAHNSPFVRPGNAGANQQLRVTTQLNDGVRLLQGQMHFVGDVPHFCHGSCDVLDAGPITDYLSDVYDWVSGHPFDVVTILLGNGQYNSVTTYQPFLEQTRLQNYAYIPPKNPMALGDWPTLATMILQGKRVVFFMDYEANQTAVPWILDEFSHMWETPFDPVDRSFPCIVQRPPDLPEDQAKNRLYLMNHNLNYDIKLLGNSILVPNIPLLNVTNNVTGFGSLGNGTAACNSRWGFPPKFLNVDYYNVGNGSVFEVAAKHNNVTYTRECCGKVASDAMALYERMSCLAMICLTGASLLML
ncbi:related to BSC1 Transcript encoded by this ORF shows a high level of stop codon bypass [Rhynchosporium secalis]|uniref:Related to BSC1 Transcript encoded by this ORF shows a high level of stop codon bypass n=1 Tax=Rhynchosporium secalis TaxID=38038 RepID=A0A1E1M7R1_RHYSE|nr:related to BSC1 Transcript encoded by this ORF shows a high level of stop codon bypass [Rhynchosporium secalis]